MSSPATVEPLWPAHPLYSATDRSEASARGALFDDGLLWTDESLHIVDFNDEAARLLGLEPHSARGESLDSLNAAVSGHETLFDAVAHGRQADVLLRTPDGIPVLASCRRGVGARHVSLVVLRDLNAFAWRRDRALGMQRDERSGNVSAPRVRPDFAAQRRLSPLLHRVLSRGERAIAQGARVLISGESGTGKSEIARYLHGTVAEASDPFVVANCAALPGSAFEAALFGNGTDGSDVTPASCADAGSGLLASAVGGTLFIDEVAELSASAQARLLGILDDARSLNAVARIGELRIVAATNRDLRERVRAGAFRADLYYRLAIVELAVPPLRDTPELVQHLVARFLRTINQRRHSPVLLPPRLLEVLEDHAFPGNVRELQNLVQRASIFIDDADDMASLIGELLAADRAFAASAVADADASATFDLRTEVRRYERALIDRAIRLHGSKRRAATALGIDIATVSRKTSNPPAEENTS